MSANIGWLFYKDYFKDLDYSKLENSKIEIQNKVANIIKQKPKIKEEEIFGNTHLKATTTYPGLLLGSGNAHELPSVKGQAILGFYFDYTSGLPVIQGSSIKGVLRSAFKHSEYIKEIVGDVDVKKLEEEIFDGGDTFFDATILSYHDEILADDYITPHLKEDEKNPELKNPELKNPIPLRFIKVAPNVTFRFDFELSDAVITKAKKLKLFETILEDLGLGAKTNVGYGKFENFSIYKTKEEIEKEEEELKLQKAKEEELKRKEQERAKQEKEQKAKLGLAQLENCKSLKDAFKILKDSFGKHPKPTPEQKEIIQKFFNKQTKLSKGDIKTFKKYGVS